MKKDGHSHTEFCPHGSGDDVELMIRKAIKFGFTEYSITEHAPLPPDFQQDYAGDPTGLTEAAMALNDLPAYFKKCRQMQTKYRDQLKINIGFELDFLPSQLAWTKDFWAEYGPQTQDNVLSVHFMQGAAAKFWCVDDTLADFKTGLLDNQNGDAQALYGQYLQALLAAAQTDLGPAAPMRLGHMTLIKKFQDYFNLPIKFNATNLALVTQLFSVLKQRHFALDLNTAGLYKPYCNETYPYSDLISQAEIAGVPLVYGSDAHSIVEVSHAYHQVEKFI
ncbi:histidinol-phosphatase HisJ [Loigolactobacillus zhaoyuanensis]|uniref:Histidinol-phosphatase n=1 Tax=Loigolactobacillus zhaoyuanensis TaxID=2486017 RepID=A0ABW8UI03_9LACO|nr:histidinol-phosphatase HisJ [Loigolactobacillus zhaoyuanensis]